MLENAADVHDNPWRTGFFKTPVEGRVYAGATNLLGDGQADLDTASNKAVLATAPITIRIGAQNSPCRTCLLAPSVKISPSPAQESVCIGDRFRIGEALFEVSQPRQPCWKLARRWRMHELTGMVLRNGRTGWYLRVLEEGWIEAGMPVALIERRNPDWSIARANEVLHHRQTYLQLTLDLAGVPNLSESWAQALRARRKPARLGPALTGPLSCGSFCSRCAACESCS